MQPFSEFFAQWVSEYYKNATIGKSGDFYTAVSVSKFFGGAIANYILKNLENGNLELPLNIVDCGANNTNLIKDIYSFLEALGIGVAENCEFYIIESNAKIAGLEMESNTKIANKKLACNLADSKDLDSKNLQVSKDSAIDSKLDSTKCRESADSTIDSPNNPKDSLDSNNSKPPKIHILKNLDSLKPLKNNTFFIANEFFDALPCELYSDGKMAFVDKNMNIRFLDSKEILRYSKNQDSNNFNNLESNEFDCSKQLDKSYPPFSGAEIFCKTSNSEVSCKTSNSKPKSHFIANSNDIGKSGDLFKNLDSIMQIAESLHIIKGEIPLSYFDFCATLRDINPENKRWIFAVFDYGDRYYNNHFNIRIFHKHKVFPLFEKINALKSYFKTSDITYNVPFLLLDKSFENIGGKKILFKKQDIALIEDFGILDLLQKFHSSKSITNTIYLKESNKIKTLLNVLNDNFKTSIYINFKPKLV
ncbi:hypothetical protein CCY99_06130 [Helicobacter sp. 16-1353]|uniref:SAM-dependent methyltransferase n=1 Tax=Helicobacter sp. 16-1353 TaxID=2004996 RepID=UPI000DCEFBC7|nr:SAM-dependent methyltransferase [Helicobacter sp. 16-1353]RAX53168.1 hypothetical protein CCY99_06130 [Helicobacter sp. 16-1353]